MARVKPTNNILTGTSGHVGKKFVIKQYSYGTVLSNYPDMSKVKPSKLQRLKNNRFRSAVAYAKAILRNPERLRVYKGKLPRGKSAYHAAIAEYLRNHP